MVYRFTFCGVGMPGSEEQFDGQGFDIKSDKFPWDIKTGDKYQIKYNKIWRDCVRCVAGEESASLYNTDEWVDGDGGVKLMLEEVRKIELISFA